MADKYKVLVGLNYPTKKGEKRAEAGDVVEDLPKGDIRDLLKAGVIEPLEGGN